MENTLQTNCTTYGLDRYTRNSDLPWNEKRIRHICRRVGTGISAQDLKSILNQTPEQFMTQLFNKTVNAPIPETPYWANYGWMDLDQIDFSTEYVTVISEWIEGMHLSKYPLRNKLMLFWSNHFVVQNGVVEQPALMYQYLDLLYRMSFGNFKDFVRQIGKSGAMLLYLNGAESTKESPNENYARELFELFTLGEGNGYTQTDITEAARALTGFRVRTYETADVVYDRTLHDTDEKTIFGRTGNWDADDLVDIMFEERADLIAYFICEKIYKYFVHPEPDGEIINDLATIFMDSNWELAPVLKTLIQSEHFVDDQVIGTIVKSPLDHTLGMLTSLDIPFESIAVPGDENEGVDIPWTVMAYYISDTMGQTILEPVDVAGWPGNRYWLSSNVLSAIYEFGSWTGYVAASMLTANFIEMAKILSGDSNDPNIVTKSIVDFYVPIELNEQVLYDRATATFKGDIPENYYTNGEWNLDWEYVNWQLTELLNHIVKLPDYLLG